MLPDNRLLTGKVREAWDALNCSLQLLDELGLSHEAALVTEACERLEAKFSRATRARGE